MGAAAAGASLGMGLGAPGIVPGIVGVSILGAIKAIRSSRTSVVMARISKENLQRLDDLVDCGLTNSRSESAAFLIAEGVKARAELYEKIHEHSQVIRNAREELRRLLGEESSPSIKRNFKSDDAVRAIDVGGHVCGTGISRGRDSLYRVLP